MRRQRQAKIVATLGPASSTPEMIEKLFLAGVDVFRINMSHSDHDNLKARYEDIRAIEKKHARPIAIDHGDVKEREGDQDSHEAIDKTHVDTIRHADPLE